MNPVHNLVTVHPWTACEQMVKLCIFPDVHKYTYTCFLSLTYSSDSWGGLMLNGLKVKNRKLIHLFPKFQNLARKAKKWGCE